MLHPRRFPRRLLLLTLTLAALVFTLAACSSSDDSITEPPVVRLLTAEEFREHVIAPQEANDVVLGQLLTAGMDTTAAMDSVLVLFLQDPNVAAGEVGQQGIAVTYRNGLLGGIFLDPLDEPLAEGPEGWPPTLAPPSPRPEPERGAKSGHRAIFLNASYHERARYANPLIDNYGALLEDAGFAPLEIFLNDEVTLDRYASLSGHRIVHIYSHGMAWPSESNLQEVYLLTGEVYSDETYDQYWDDLQEGDVICIRRHNGLHTFFVSPQFIDKHNDLGDDTLFYGGFCYSGLGSWPEVMVEREGVGGYFGFDWSVWTYYNAYWNFHLMRTLLSDRTSPYKNVNDWLTNDTVKWYQHRGRVVHIEYTGQQLLKLFDEDHPPCDESEQDHDDGFVHARVRVLNHGVPVNEASVRVDYRKIYCDGHTDGINPIMGETGPDGVYSANTIGIFRLGNTQEMIQVKATVRGEVQQKLFPFSAFNGMDGGSIFFPLRAEFVFNF